MESIRINANKDFNNNTESGVIVFNTLRRKLRYGLKRRTLKDNVLKRYVEILGDYDLRLLLTREVFFNFRMNIFHHIGEEVPRNLYEDTIKRIVILIGDKIVDLSTGSDGEDIGIEDFFNGLDCTIECILEGIGDCVLSYRKHRDYELFKGNSKFIYTQVQNILWSVDDTPVPDSMVPYYEMVENLIEAMCDIPDGEEENDPLYQYRMVLERNEENESEIG